MMFLVFITSHFLLFLQQFFNPLSRQLESLIALPTLQVIVEKVCIQSCLYHTTDPNNPLAISWFSKVSVYPIEYVQASIGSQQKDIVSSQVINILRPLHKDKLWQNSNRF